MKEESDFSHTSIYTIMPDYAGAYGWRSHNPEALGGCHASREKWAGSHPISAELEAAFATWQEEFERAPYVDGIAMLDWQHFHEHGIELTRRLKRELGDKARVFYEKPMEDPNRRQGERVKLNLDGTLTVPPEPKRLKR